MTKLKLQLRLFQRFLLDFFSGVHFRWAKIPKQELLLPYSTQQKQEIKASTHFENKLFNLQLAAERINGVVLLPNQIFSFWKMVGPPNSDFKSGRTLVGGKVKEDVGGGICQVSGLIYQTCLSAGLHILERHNHSVDLYTDETRFAPLGMDATVAYGYKDLRIKNPFPFPLQMNLKILGNELFLTLKSKENLIFLPLVSEVQHFEKSLKVQVWRNQELMSTSEYQKLSE